MLWFAVAFRKLASVLRSISLALRIEDWGESGHSHGFPVLSSAYPRCIATGHRFRVDEGLVVIGRIAKSGVSVFIVSVAFVILFKLVWKHNGSVDGDRQSAMASSKHDNTNDEL